MIKQDQTVDASVKQGLAALLIEDFQLTYGPVSPRCVAKIKDSGSSSLAWRFVADFFLCHLIFGPAVIAVWRGTWDYYLIGLDDIFGVTTLFLDIITAAARD